MSDQLPIVISSDQVTALRKLLDRVICREADEITIRQSRGPVAVHALFVDVIGSNREGEGDANVKTTFVISFNGDMAEWLV